FFVELGRRPEAGEFPGADVLEMLIVALSLAIGVFVFGAKVRAARFVPIERVLAQERPELQKIGDAAGLLQRPIEVFARSGHAYVAPKLLAQLGNALKAFLESVGGPRHAAAIPHQLAEFAVKLSRSSLAIDCKQFAGTLRDLGL